jgi:hypothetical protein
MHNAVWPGKRLGVIVNSPGGRYDVATSMAIWLRDYRRAGWHVDVGVAGMCASSCLTLLAMGERRFLLGENSGVYVHTIVVTNDDTGETHESLDTSVQWGRFLKAAGAPDSVVGKLLLTPSRQAAPLTALGRLGNRNPVDDEVTRPYGGTIDSAT